MKSFDQKIALITGAGAGIGRALAIQLAELGCHLALCDINTELLAETESLCREKNNQIKLVSNTLDTADRQAVYAFAELFGKTFSQLDILINNAGISMGEVTVADLEYDDLDRIMDINFKGMVYFNKAFLPLMPVEQASIVNISSIFGLIGSKFSAAYVASKFAIYGFTQVLRHELLQTGIKVHAVFPAGIKTSISKNALKKELRNPSFEKNLTISPEAAASKIIKGIKSGNERILIGKEAYFVDIASRLLPVWAPKIINKYFIKR